MHEDGLIGFEVFTALMQRIEDLRSAAEGRPRLDIALQRAELVKKIPLFAGLDDTAISRLSRALRTRYVQAGEVVVHRGSPVAGVYFIASGAVEVDTAAQTRRLGGGEWFGQLSVLKKHARHSEARAIAPSTLLVLDERRFRRLLRRNSSLLEGLRGGASTLGIEVEDLLGEEDPSTIGTPRKSS